MYPSEEIDKWYSKVGSKPPSGKLYNRVINESRKFKKGARDYDETERKNIKKQRTDVDEILLSELRAVSIDDNEKLETLWTKTFNIRDRGTSIDEYFDRFPHLKAPFGAKLVSKYCDIETLSSF